jgi:hypothetical protein
MSKSDLPRPHPPPFGRTDAIIEVRRYPEVCQLISAGNTGRSSHKAVVGSLEARSPSGRRAVTLRSCSDAHQAIWLIHYSDVRVGSIAIRVGVPADADRWAWSCGIYPNARSLRDDSGTAPNFKAARRDFDAAWRVMLPKLTEADFEAWRQQRDYTAWNYAMRDAGLKTPTATGTGISKCLCGETITIGNSWEHILTVHTVTE